jgi:single-strand selective monofunctional uracil DNA glycosylase
MPASGLVSISLELSQQLDRLDFGSPVAHVYNPLAYAWAPHRAYLERWGGTPKRTVLLGMNPGPWGMAQTGVPFGEVAAVRDWLAITGQVTPPPEGHPKKPVLGFGCRRSEVSGRRLWGWAAHLWGSAEAFFRHFFVHNYCPLMFLEAGGRNLTPDRLARADREALLELCDHALARAAACLEPAMVVGVGAFAAQRAAQALADCDVKVGQILHPSPASPAANRGWAEQATRQLLDLGVELPQPT